jgi:hypothetical protein
MKFLLVPALLSTAILFASGAYCIAKGANLASTAVAIAFAAACLVLAIVIIAA